MVALHGVVSQPHRQTTMQTVMHAVDTLIAHVCNNPVYAISVCDLSQLKGSMWRVHHKTILLL